jgi:hypothetical protein
MVVRGCAAQVPPLIVDSRAVRGMFENAVSRPAPRRLSPLEREMMVRLFVSCATVSCILFLEIRAACVVELPDAVVLRECGNKPRKHYKPGSAIFSQRKLGNRPYSFSYNETQIVLAANTASNLSL